jgi:hypothetical protein
MSERWDPTVRMDMREWTGRRVRLARTVSPASRVSAAGLVYPGSRPRAHPAAKGLPDRKEHTAIPARRAFSDVMRMTVLRGRRGCRAYLARTGSQERMG